MNRYIKPEIAISLFDADCVLTASGYTKETTSNLPSIYSPQSEAENPTYIKSVSYSDMSE